MELEEGKREHCLGQQKTRDSEGPLKGQLPKRRIKWMLCKDVIFLGNRGLYFTIYPYCSIVLTYSKHSNTSVTS
jgi:hypothetical protein